MKWISVKHGLPPQKAELDYEGDTYSDQVVIWVGDGWATAQYNHSNNEWVSDDYFGIMDKVTHWCSIKPPNSPKGKYVFSKGEINQIRMVLSELRKTESTAQKSKREKLLRKKFNFYIQDFLPTHKSLVTGYVQSTGMEARHLDELLEAGIIKLQ